MKHQGRASFGSLKGNGFDCPLTQQFPFVCNRCERFASCTRIRYSYDGMAAHNQANQLLRTAK